MRSLLKCVDDWACELDTDNDWEIREDTRRPL